MDASVGYYLNGAENVSQLTNALIKCDGQNGCSSINGVNGYYINSAVSNMLNNALILCSSNTCNFVEGKMNSIYLNNGSTSNSLIQCSLDNCATIDSKSELYGTNDNPYYFINSSKEASVNRIIECKTSSQCITKMGNANTVYLNGNLKTNKNTNGEENKPLIICSSENVCTTERSSLNKKGIEFYINAGSNQNNNLIRCIHDAEGVTCQVTKDTYTSNDIFYINGNYARDGKYLIKCNGKKQCSIYDKNINNNKKEYYPHGGYDSGNKLKNAIIQCDGITQNDKLTAICSLISESKVNDIYINANDMKLIKCSSTGCSAYDDSSNASLIKYYVNAAETYNTSYSSLLIKCDGTCRASNGFENSIFLNGNFNTNSNNADSVNNLIQCVNGKCNVFNGSGSNDKPSYFINAALIASSNYSNRLIKCTNVCQTENGAENDVYINGNYNKSTGDKINNLIICSSNKCEAKANNAVNGMDDYYINSGAVNTLEKLKDTLIKCTFNGCEVFENISNVINESVSEVFFINKNYNTIDHNNYLIKCTSNDGCVNYKNPSSNNSDEYYIHGAATDFTNSIVKCTFNKGNASCNILKTAGNNHIYINASNSKLIRCSGIICTAYNDIGDNVKYFVNAVGIPNDLYSDLLIRCNEGNCKIVEGNDGQTYPNGNFNSLKIGSGDYINNIIKCGNNICSATKGKNGKYNDE